MKKRTTITIVAVTALLVIAFVSGSVFAQGDILSSSDGSPDNLPSYTSDEAAPGNLVQVADGVSSSQSGANLAANTSPFGDESAFIFSSPGGSSSSDAAPDGPNGAMIKGELLQALETDNPNAPTWNTTLRFVGSTLKPRENNVDYLTNSQGGCVYVTGGDAYTVWNLPLALPNGTKVEYLRMYYVDNDPANATYGWFTKYDLYGTIVQEWSVTSADGGAGYRDVLITPTQTIDYNQYSYVINWRPVAPGATLQLCGFRLFYTQIGFNFIPWISKH